MGSQARLRRAVPINRRRFLRSIGAGIGLGASAGCQNQDGSRGTPLGTTRRGTITIEYVDVAGARSESVFDPLMEELNAEFDDQINVQITSLPYDNMKRQLTTRVGGGNPPDVAALDQIWLGEFIDSGGLLPLDEVTAAIDFDDYLPAFREPVVADGHPYGVPIVTDVRGMYWNKDYFAAAGLDPKTPPTTWPELIEVTDRLHDPPNHTGACYFVNGGRWSVSLFGAGGSILTDARKPAFHEPPGVAAATFLDDLYNTHDIATDNPIYQNGAQMAREFLDGQYAINLIEGSWLDYFWRNMGNDSEVMLDRFGFAPTPHPPDGSPATMSGGFVWTGFADTAHPDVVRAFLRVAGSREFKRHLAIETGAIPIRESLQDDASIWDEILYADAILEMLETARTRPIRHWPLIASELDSALQHVAFDRKAPEAALTSAARRVDANLPK